VGKPLLLSGILCAVAAGVLVALALHPELNLPLQGPSFQTFLFLAIAVTSWLGGWWLRSEVVQRKHPGIAILMAGFQAAGLAWAGGAFTRGSTARGWFTALAGMWTTTVVVAAALAICVPPVRRALDRWSRRHPPLVQQGLWFVFCCYVAACGFGLRRWIATRDAQALAWMFPVCLLMCAAALALILLLYLRSRRPVVLSFGAGLVVFMLFLAAQMLGPPGHLLWWYGNALYFTATVVIAWGVLESERVRERELLIAELDSLSHRLADQSVRDELTGIYNRRFAVEALEDEFQKAQRANLPVTLLIGDLDSFKSINDTYGHPFGDFVLKEAARRLSHSLRGSDLLARCGGEEFWVILPLTNRVGGQEVAQKLLESIRAEPYQQGDVSIRVTISIGIADSLACNANDVATLIKEADRALYQAKREGKDRAVILDPLSFSVPRP
jgi:diguanylate cyclase (GGDEF)-like protein